MIPYREARDLVRQHVEVTGTEQVAAAECTGRVLARDVVSRISSPPFDKAAMDGFAVRGEDVADLPAELELVGESFAGSWPRFTVGPGECARIATGAPVPEGADMVVMVEHTTELTDGRIRVGKLSGGNVCAEGEDIRKGQTVLRAGEMMTPMKVGVAASAGHPRLTVHRRPSVALLCTGTEVIEPHGEPERGQIYNSNGPMLTALLEPLSGKFSYLGLAGDRREDLEGGFREALMRDFFIASGGVSVGRYDLVPEVLESLGVEIIFHGWAVKPGRPLLFGRRGDASVFCLPGNPQSCFVLFHVILRAALAAAGGREQLPPEYRTGVLTERVTDKSARRSFKPCRLEVRNSTNYLRPIPYMGSADITNPSGANAYLTVPRGTEEMEQGEQVWFFEV